MQAKSRAPEKEVDLEAQVRYRIHLIQHQFQKYQQVKDVPPENLFEQGLIFFNSGRFYDAHEAWEDLWRITNGPLKRLYQGLIQAAVGLHHLSRGNTVGASGLLHRSLNHLSGFTAQLPEGTPSIDLPGLILQLREISEEMQPQSVKTVHISRLTRL